MIPLPVIVGPTACGKTATGILVAEKLNGRQVASLAKASGAFGSHRVVWDAGSLASGEYVVTMTTGEGVHSRPVVLAR